MWSTTRCLHTRLLVTRTAGRKIPGAVRAPAVLWLLVERGCTRTVRRQRDHL